MLALVQILVIQFYLPAFIPFFEFETWKLIALILSVCFLAAGGNLINTFFDQQTDLINQSKQYKHYKQLGKRRTILAYVIFSVVGLVLGFCLSFEDENYLVFGIYFFVFISLYVYSKYLKGRFLIGNFLVSLLVGLSIFQPWLIAVNLQYFSFQHPVFQIFSYYILFSMFINFGRELVKDAEDIVGDYASNHRTFPIVLGKKRCKQFIQLLVFVCLIGLISVYFRFFTGQLFPMLYVFLVLISTGLFIFVKAGKAKQKKDFSKLSTAFKIWMFLGLISLVFY